jgi:hypothetical protein
MTRLTMLMEPEIGNPHEACGVLNPAAARGPDGQLYLFRGSRIALACSKDLLRWTRMGLAAFAAYDRFDLANVDDKDASLFPQPIPNHAGKLQLGMLHRPLFPGTRPEETVHRTTSSLVDLDRESIWISYSPSLQGVFNSHHRLATPTSPWEKLKIGGGAPPLLTRQKLLATRAARRTMGARQKAGIHGDINAPPVVTPSAPPVVSQPQPRTPAPSPVASQPPAPPATPARRRT